MLARLKIGLNLKESKIVTKEETAAKIGSGILDVFGTPYMIALMEKTSMEILMPYLEEGESSVGTYVNIKHLRANKIGDKVDCISTITNIKGKKISFEVKVMYGDILVGEGTHERFVINVEKFLSKL